MPIETYEVSGQIRIQKGNKTMIRRFKKRDMDITPPADVPAVYDKILLQFSQEIQEETEQTTLEDAGKKPAEKKKP